MIQTAAFIRMLESDSRWIDDTKTTERETRDVLAARAFTQAIAWLEHRQGSDPRKWAWGPLHTMSFPHQPFGQTGLAPLDWIFNSHTVQVPGEPLSVNAGFIDSSRSLAENPKHPFAVVSGPGFRFIADLSALNQSTAATPVGQSGLLFHPHREDQVDLWQRVGHHSMPFEREQVSRDAKETLLMTPTSSTEGTR
jgi:penicillin amidase